MARYVYDGDLPVICDTCREMKRYEGPRKRQEIVCGCPRPEKAKPRLNTARKGRRNTMSLMPSSTGRKLSQSCSAVMLVILCS